MDNTLDDFGVFTRDHSVKYTRTAVIFTPFSTVFSSVPVRSIMHLSRSFVPVDVKILSPCIYYLRERPHGRCERPFHSNLWQNIQSLPEYDSTKARFPPFVCPPGQAAMIRYRILEPNSEINFTVMKQANTITASSFILSTRYRAEHTSQPQNLLTIPKTNGTHITYPRLDQHSIKISCQYS